VINKQEIVNGIQYLVNSCYNILNERTSEVMKVKDNTSVQKKESFLEKKTKKGLEKNKKRFIKE
jgi:hypothetical protein